MCATLTAALTRSWQNRSASVDADLVPPGGWAAAGGGIEHRVVDRGIERAHVSADIDVHSSVRRSFRAPEKLAVPPNSGNVANAITPVMTAVPTSSSGTSSVGLMKRVPFQSRLVTSFGRESAQSRRKLSRRDDRVLLLQGQQAVVAGD